MKYLLRLAALLACLVAPSLANAATCFWVGGTGAWSTSNTASWASSSGGTTGTCAATGGIPKQAADTATFDGASGGGTVTVGSTINGVTLTTITMGAFTGTLDFATNNPSITLTTQFSITGAGTRTLNLGSGTFTFTAANGTTLDCGNVTGLTLNAGTSTMLFSAVATGNRFINPGNKTWNNITVTNGSLNSFPIEFGNGTAFTVANLTMTNVQWMGLVPAATITVTGTLSYNGSSTSAPSILMTRGAAGTLSVAGATSITNMVVQNVVKAGAGSITCNPCYDSGGNTGVTITAPASGGGGIISG